MKAIIANLGFVLQTSGVLTLLAVIPGFIYNEQTQLIAFFITSTVFLVAGFAMNALSQKKDLDFKSSCILISIVFLVLGVVGAIPYLYSNVFSSAAIPTKIINSIFESISGFTTTGASMIASPSLLPKSLIFYRSLTQWIGGIGIVFIILAFFNSNGALDKLGKAIGFTKLTSNLQNSYIRILGIYSVYTLLFFALLYAFGLRNWIDNLAIVFSGVSTGGFSPVDNLASIIVFPNNMILGLLMLIGGTSFMVHFHLFNGNFKKLPNIELVCYLVIVLVLTALFAITTKVDLANSFFHVTSASSTTGYSYIDLSSVDVTAKMLLFILMFIGGMTSSTAGGVKVMSILIFFKSIPWMVQGVFRGTLGIFVFRGKEYKTLDVFVPLMLIVLSIVLIVGLALIFTAYGYTLLESVFALTSALSTAGLYAGITNDALPALLKFILMFLMIVGRVGIIALLVAFTRQNPMIKVDTRIIKE
jgi:trk system potassium uptake protein